jgi:ATP-binding cassette subfamily B protein
LNWWAVVSLTTRAASTLAVISIFALGTWLTLGEFFQGLDTRSNVAEQPGATALPQVRGQVDFEGVSFGYASGRLALANVDLTVPAGTTVVLVGHAGAGKTTAPSWLGRVVP